ncbi:hypothetical protein Cme02nite_21800 [Catellatospora methionotrophica]|uniref:Uncharacterized protein n=1 Tax=Catellatospora methionotrophica TaxID=121620 RepID=A0A8J3PEZ6_9ACTN|nr:hypothetical protein Cme02nite_21800 [Catellatospora methionotrophica]
MTSVTWWVADGLAGVEGLLGAAATAGVCRTARPAASSGATVAAEISCQRLRREREGCEGENMTTVYRPAVTE